MDFHFVINKLKYFLIGFNLDKDLHYDHLAMGLKEALENDKSALDADRLQKYTGRLDAQFYVLN